MTTNDEKSIMDSSTLNNSSPSIDEKPRLEAEESVRQGSSSPSPTPSVSEKIEQHGEHNLRNVDSAKEAQAELTKIMTNGEGPEYPTGMKLGLISMALCLSVFLMALDNSIIATAIPKITDQFHSLSDVGWYGSAYLLTTASFQLLFGKFYTFFSIKWVYLIAIGIFELGSLLCGVAPNSTALIVGRAVAGVGSAGIFSGVSQLGSGSYWRWGIHLFLPPTPLLDPQEAQP
ncbi:Efflux pump aflT [Lachnellula arida]|uniref:Efflux pump aflT n=1 Tax=Lachnellula arida TaxID=1316785 RepID=A0A8T9BQS6_9HELO|nr:Efflux pump aflT [Lachnellula arida]